jgi:hypothetical protein
MYVHNYGATPSGFAIDSHLFTPGPIGWAKCPPPLFSCDALRTIVPLSIGSTRTEAGHGKQKRAAAIAYSVDDKSTSRRAMIRIMVDSRTG